MFGRRRRSQADFSKELQAHLELEMDRLRAEGLPEDQAYHAARRNLGNLAAAGERFYESGRCLWLENLGHDTRHALRRLRKAPAFTITATLTLALGIGATTSIFTLVHAVLLQSLPVANPGRLYRIGKEIHCCVWGGYSQDGEYSIVSYDLYKHFRNHTEGFEEMAAFQAGGTLLGVRRAHNANAAETYPAEFVSGNYFAMFGVSAYAGRALTAADDRAGAPPAAVMSYRLWQQKFALDPSVIGAAFSLNDKPFTIVGVAPPGFYGDTLRNEPPDFFLPLETEPLVQGDSSLLQQVDAHWLDLIGRLRVGARVPAIEAQMRVELQQWLRWHIGDMDANERARLPRQTVYLSPGGAGITSMREAYEHWLHILMMVSAFVLLIVCANVANLMLVRGMERRQQTSLSMALGARTWRLVLPALTESIVLSLLGGAAGLAVAFAGTRLILRLAFPSLTASPISASPSIPVLLFAFGISLITGVAFGMAPAWMATRVDPVEALRGANRATRPASLGRKTLVVLQAALSLVLLSAAGLLTAALRNLEHQDFGFEQVGRTVVNIDPVLAGYKPAQLDSLYRRIHESLGSIPGVSSVDSCLYTPQSGDSWNDSIFVEGRAAPGPKDDYSSSWNRVTAGYFATIGNPIVKGRPISGRDTAASPHVAVINEAFARKFFGSEDPIGKHFGRTDIKTAGEFEVIGVAKDARYLTYNLQKPIGAFFFLPVSQSTVFAKEAFNVGEVRSHFLHDIVVLMRPGARLQEAQVRRALAGVDPNMPVVRMQSLSEQVAGNFSQQRLIARLTSLFGSLALVLASVGLYGVTAYNVGSRTNEIGVRMALGADRGSVLALILRGALLQIVLGLLLGVPLTLAAGRFLGSQLYGINHYDPTILAVAMLAIGASALMAALIPALRASSIPPIQALRAE
ncbi:MAG TPA: ABC transporter permease [Candidatus Acidoferrales bacterium]|nr:ABC transporter permease [Candidatus Acidoferrales bacterium]